ncbi:MAG: hypothetical protein ACK4NY_11490 [Spirosomataceae bacterium]
MINKVSLVFSIIILKCFIIYLIVHLSPLPYGDDLDQILWLTSLKMLPTMDSLKFFFTKVNEHFVIFTRIITLIDFQIFGKSSSVHWTIIGLILFISSLLLTIFTFSFHKSRYWTLLLGISLVWLDPKLYENILWGFTSLQHNFIVFITLISSYLIIYKEDNKSFIFSIILTICGVFSSGNGLILPFLLGIICIDKSYKKAITYFLCFFVSCLIFWLSSGDSQNGISIPNFLQFFKTCFYFLVFNIDITDGKQTSLFIIFGILSSLYLIISILLNYKNDRIYKFIFIGFAFVFVSGLMVALKRSNLNVQSIDLGVRYNLYSKLYVLILISTILYQLRENRTSHSILVFVVLVPLCLISYWKNINKTKGFMNLSIANWYNIKHVNFDEKCEQIRWKRHVLPSNTNYVEPFSKENIQKIRSSSFEKEQININISEDNELILFNNTTFSTTNKSIFILLKNQSDEILLNSVQSKNSIKDFFVSQNYYGKGFLSFLKKKKCNELFTFVENSYTKTGQYDVLVIVVEDLDIKLFNTYQKVKITCK